LLELFNFEESLRSVPDDEFSSLDSFSVEFDGLWTSVESEPAVGDTGFKVMDGGVRGVVELVST
jgi:hypothetical protein